MIGSHAVKFALLDVELFQPNLETYFLSSNVSVVSI